MPLICLFAAFDCLFLRYYWRALRLVCHALLGVTYIFAFDATPLPHFEAFFFAASPPRRRRAARCR